MAGYKVYLGLNGDGYKTIIKQKPSIAVIEFSEFTDAQIKKLLDQKIKLIAYLNVGAIEKTRGYYKLYKQYAIGNYSDWDEKWMDLSKEKWQEFLVFQAKVLKKRGATGLYIDNLDVVEEYKNKKLYEPARKILKTIRKETGLYLIVNGADYFTLIKNIDKDKCGSQTKSECERLKKYCVAVKKSGIEVFLLEYKPSAANKVKISKFCKKYGLHACNAKNVNLDK